MLESHCRKVKFLIKIQKPKKGPSRGTPHNLSKVSLEVKELEITDRYTAASKNNSKLDQVGSNQSRRDTLTIFAKSVERFNISR
jgi:hypothetical protein